MVISQWYKPQDIWKYYYEECRNSFYAVIIKNKSYAIYNPQTKILYLQYFLRNQPTVEFRLRKQVQYSLKKYFGCEDKTILCVDIQKETNLQSYFIKFEFYGRCDLPTDEKMTGAEKLINKVCESLDQSTAVEKI
jgi:hypothetical protein